MVAVRHLSFLKVCKLWGLICAIMQNFVKIVQTASKILRFFDF